jgi:hypothetical protein
MLPSPTMLPNSKKRSAPFAAARVAAFVIAALALPPLAHAQFSQLPMNKEPGAVYDSDVPNEKPGPAPRRDLSGIWEPAHSLADDVGADGAKSAPADGKPEHEPPFTPEGKKAYEAHKPTYGYRQVPPTLSNDPMPGCDPQGFPRIALHNFRTSWIVQNANNVLVLYEFNKKWRVIWTDGRKLPANAEDPSWSYLPDLSEPRWWGYSVGKWVDDYTFEAESNGFNERTWLDNAGRPHSNALHVIERYHRVDAKHLEMSIIIDDPKYYTKPWVALDRLSLRLQSPTFDFFEQECSPSESKEYNDLYGEPASEDLGNTPDKSK